MEEMNGNEIAVKLKEKGYQGLLIQCSGIFMPTPETIKISPYRYLLKQYTGEEIRKENVTPNGSPALVKPMKRGMDEQEQNGVSVPRRAAIRFAIGP